MKKQNLLFILLLALSSYGYSQSVQIDGVKGYRFTGVHPITTGESDEVKGYYTYYMQEKAAKGMRTFQFSIIDKEVKTVVKTDITLHKFAVINNTIFNGKRLLISWDDRKNKKSVFKIIDDKGKVVKTKEIPVEKKFQVGTTVFPMSNGEGFYIVRTEFRKKVTGYSIEKVDNELKQIWKKEQIPAVGNKTIAGLINTPTRFAIWEEVNPKGKKVKPMIVCFDAKTGEKIYERDGYDGTSTIIYNRLLFDKMGKIYAGGAYVDGEKYKSVNNTGIYLLKLDERGKEELYTKVNNAEKIQAVLKGNSKGLTLGSKDKVFIEDLIIEDDKIIVVSEMFRKNANMTPKMIQRTRDLITGKFIGRPDNDHPNKMVFEVMDFMMFKFSQKGVLEEIKPIHKEEYNKITVWHPYTYIGGQTLARIMSGFGWFDYGFTVTAENGKKYMVCKNNASPRRPEVFTYSLSESYAKSKINLKQEGKIDLEKSKVSYFNTMRNTNSNVAVAYYQRKLKRITVNLENLFK